MLRLPNYIGALTAGLVLLGTAAAASGQDLSATDPDRRQLTIYDRPKSYVDLKYNYTVRQQRDFTCGAAARRRSPPSSNITTACRLPKR